MNSVADVWDNILQQLKKELSETTIATWFDELEAVDIQGNVFILHCSNDFKKGYIESLFMKNIKASLHDIFSTDFEVRILDDQDYAEFQGNAPKKQSERFTSAEFTFETFVVGPSNKLAYAASVSVAEHPAQNYNPLLIYGDSGLGKTHMLYAIANVIRRNDRHAKIVYIKGDDFINEFIELIRAGRGNEFRAKYREADLLLVDDIQFVAGKEQVQNEFFHTFNTLYESGRQIVLTSDRPPSEMTLLDDRLRTRFEWGLLVDVAPPDFETRLAIVKNKAAILGMELPDLLQQVDDQTPPTFLFATQGDHLVPATQSLQFATLLAERKIPYEMHIFAYGDHGFSTGSRHIANPQNPENPESAVWQGMALGFLNHIFNHDVLVPAPEEVKEFCLDMKIGTLLDTPQSAALIQQLLPELAQYVQQEPGSRGISVNNLQFYSNKMFDEEKLSALNEALAKLN